MSADDPKEVIENMRKVSGAFYFAAVQTGNHPFIEFCGLMNEYIKVCEHLRKKGVDFTDVSIHSGIAVQVPEYMLKYAAEKFSCIFKPMLSTDRSKMIFINSVLEG